MWVILGSDTGNWLSRAREIIKIPRFDRLTNDSIDVCLKVAGRADRHGGNTIGPHRTSGQTNTLIRLTIECQPIATEGV